MRPRRDGHRAVQVRMTAGRLIAISLPPRRIGRLIPTAASGSYIRSTRWSRNIIHTIRPSGSRIDAPVVRSRKSKIFSRKERRGRKGLGYLFLAVGCAEDERSESEGRFGEAEPVGCASIRERVDRVEERGLVGVLSWSARMDFYLFRSRTRTLNSNSYPLTANDQTLTTNCLILLQLRQSAIFLSGDRKSVVRERV